MGISITTFAFLAYATLISAQCQQAAVGSEPTPGYQSVTSPSTDSPVTAGSPAVIKWGLGSSPASSNVALQLCVGPAVNCKPDRCITESTANQAQSFTWQVPSDLAPSVGGGYGILIIEVGTGKYQYSQQFGVKAGSTPASSSSTPASPASQISDGQIQVPTGSIKPTQIFPLYTPTGATGSAGTGLYFVPAPTGKVSNSTYLSGYKPSYGPNTAPPGLPINVNATQYQTMTPGVSGAPTGGVLPVTSVAVATAGTPNGPLNPSVAPSSTGVLTSPQNAAGKVVAGGLVAGLGAVAALML